MSGPMDHVTLGRSRLRVSRIAFGTWQFSGEWGSTEERDSTAAIRRALELEINFFDTAQAYGFGASEELLGRALRDELRSRRDEIVIATKGGLRAVGGGVERDSSPEFLRSGVEDSLRHLGVDYIDLYQVHWPDPDTPIEETAGALDELFREGKIRHVGVSNYSAEQMEAFESVRPVETLQPPYHLFRRDIEEGALPWARRHEVGVLAYSPLAHGLLTGKFHEDTSFPNDDWRSSSDVFDGDEFKRNLEIVRDLERFAEERNHTVTEIAVAWTLAQPGVHVAIVGARKLEHIEGSAPAGDLKLSDADLGQIEQIMAGAVPVGGPSPEG
jgi:aryl-alcohol dehydrogenase-like predicted oxidoreductase